MDLWKFHNGRVQSHRNTCSVNTLFDDFFTVRITFCICWLLYMRMQERRERNLHAKTFICLIESCQKGEREGFTFQKPSAVW